MRPSSWTSPPEPTTARAPTGNSQPPPSSARKALLGIQAATRGGVVDRTRRLDRHLVTRPALDRQRTLPYLGQHRRGGENLRRQAGEAEALQGRVGGDYRSRGRHLGKPGGQVAPQFFKAQVRPHPGELRPSSRSARCDMCPGTEVGERPAHERVPRIGPLVHGGYHELAGTAGGRKVLRRVDGKVRAAIDQGLLDFLHEGALAPDRRDRTIPVQVTGRLDHDELDGDRLGDDRSGGRDQRLGNDLGLTERERAATSRDPERRHVPPTGRTGCATPRRAVRRAVIPLRP